MVVLNHVKAHENELSSDWLKQLASQSSPPPVPVSVPGNGNANDNDDLVLLGNTIIVAPPIEQQIPTEAKATTIATAAANNYASDNPAVQEPTTQVCKRHKDYGPPTRHLDRLCGATKSLAELLVGSSAGLPAGPLTRPPAVLLVQQPPQTYKPSNIKEALTRPHQDKWRAAIVEEMHSLHKNHTWDLVKRPKD